MNFITPENATSAQVEAVVSAGMEAMANGEKNVSFLHWGSPEHKEHEKRMKIKQEEEDKMGKKENEEDDVVLCEECGEEPCVFSTHQELLSAYDEAEHGCLEGDDVPENNIR